MASDILAGDSEVCAEAMSALRATHRVGGGQSLGKASLKRAIGTLEEASWGTEGGEARLGGKERQAWAGRGADCRARSQAPREG